VLKGGNKRLAVQGQKVNAILWSHLNLGEHRKVSNEVARRFFGELWNQRLDQFAKWLAMPETRKCKSDDELDMLSPARDFRKKARAQKNI
jgi:hypothetical protein